MTNAIPYSALVLFDATVFPPTTILIQTVPPVTFFCTLLLNSPV